MGKETGKPLTNAQRKLLQTSGTKDTTNWRYIKQTIISDDDKVSKNIGKTIYLVFSNTETGEIKMVSTK